MTNANAVAEAVAEMVERLEPDTDSMIRKPEMQMFKYLGDNGENAVRCVIREDGEPLFVAADVCRVLELTNPTEALRGLDSDEVTILRIAEGSSGNPNVNVITEAGLYSLVLRSRKPEAKKFRRWVTHEVLPSIRKRGAYLTPEVAEEVLLNPDFLMRLCSKIKSARAKNVVLTEMVRENAPKVEYHDAVMASEELITVADMAALLKKNGVEIGRDRLFTWMRHNKFLCSRGSDRNRPSYVSQVMEILTCHNTFAADGTPRLQPLVTPKGQTYFLRCFGIITA